MMSHIVPKADRSTTENLAFSVDPPPRTHNRPIPQGMRGYDLGAMATEPHLGRFLQGVLEELSLSITEAAQRAEFSRSTMQRLLERRSAIGLHPATWRKLAKMAGVTPRQLSDRYYGRPERADDGDQTLEAVYETRCRRARSRRLESAGRSLRSGSR